MAQDHFWTPPKAQGALHSILGMHFKSNSMIFEQINMHAPLAMFLVGRHNLQTPHPSCMLLAQPAACTGLPCVVHSFWLCLIFCARYSFNSILEAPNFWVRCSRLFFPEKMGPYFWKPLTCGYVAQGCFSKKKSRLFETLRKSSQGPCNFFAYHVSNVQYVGEIN